MRAVLCHAWGPVEGLRLGDAPPPIPADGEVVIAVKAAGINYADAIMVAGHYQTKPPLPFSPGLEAAGIVTACGDGVTRFRPGDRVMAILAHGGLAELAAAPEAETFTVPDGMSFEEAGAFPIAYISSHVALRWQARLEPGETLLVLGAAGGVGLTAVEIGKAMGARVIAAASTAEKLAVAQERGADEVVNYAAERLTDRVMALTEQLVGQEQAHREVAAQQAHQQVLTQESSHRAQLTMRFSILMKTSTRKTFHFNQAVILESWHIKQNEKK